MTGPRASIAICTFNRSALLAQVLDDIAAQLPSDPSVFEVLIIDNNSSDGTAQMIASRSGAMPLRSVIETRQGTVFARNRALQECRGEFLIFLDDDIRLAAGWLDGYQRELIDTDRIAVAGSVVSTWPADVPGWVGDTADPPFPGVTVHYVPGDRPRAIGLDDPLPFTANLGVRIDLARQIGFREDLGHVRGKPMGGDDMDFCRRFIERFGPMWYQPAIRVDHPVVASRLSLRHTFGYLFRGAMAEAWYAPPPAGGRRIGPIPLWLPRRMMSDLGSGLAGLLTGNSRRLIAGVGGVVRAAGTGWGLLNQPKG